MAHDPTIDDYDRLQAKLNRVLAERQRGGTWINVGLILVIILAVVAFWLNNGDWLLAKVSTTATTTIQALPTAAPASAPIDGGAVQPPAPNSAGQVPAAAPIVQENSAQPASEAPVQGGPVISETQADQQQQALQLAADEAAAAQLDARREESSSRPPDISAEQAKALVGRNPCSVPRADPQTCAAGSWKPATVVAVP